MEEKIVGKALGYWVNKLHEAGATKQKYGKVVVNPVVRAHITAMHVALAGDIESRVFEDLESAFEGAMSEANEMMTIDGAVALLP